MSSASASCPTRRLGHGFLTGQIRTVDDIPDDDWRKTNPRFVGENFERNLRIVDEVKQSPPRPVRLPHRSRWPGSSPRATTSLPSLAPGGWHGSRRTRPPTVYSSAPNRSTG